MKRKMLKSFCGKLLALACTFSILLSVPTLDAKAANETLLHTYGSAYGYSGTCINLYQLRDAGQLAALNLNSRHFIPRFDHVGTFNPMNS